VPILPLIDLLLLLGTGSLFVGFLLKAISITTRFNPHVLGFTSIDFVLIAGVCMGLALVLAARTWDKINEPRLVALRRRSVEEKFRREQMELERAAAALDDDGSEVEVLGAPPSQARRGIGRERR
jgi:UDP-N-acetylmuramyl pentapeptide phosphotransferase/UDP-N-acetylglucosamine-1-phosphate transferase